MTEEIIKCVKGESCIHCGSTYCRFVDEVNELKQENKELKEYSQRMENQRENYYKEYNKYRSALEEIREVIYYCGHKDVVDKVLPRINEVLNLS